MKRISESQRVKIVRLFQDGTNVFSLATAWEVPIDRVEDIIREAMNMADVQP